MTIEIEDVTVAMTIQSLEVLQSVEQHFYCSCPISSAMFLSKFCTMFT